MSDEEPEMFFERFSVVVIEHRDSGWFSAQCLERDIAVQAQGFHNVLCELKRVLKGHIAISRDQNVRPFQDIPKAPQKFWELFGKSDIQLTHLRPTPSRQDMEHQQHTVLDYNARLASPDTQLV